MFVWVICLPSSFEFDASSFGAERRAGFRLSTLFVRSFHLVNPLPAIPPAIAAAALPAGRLEDAASELRERGFAIVAAASVAAAIPNHAMAADSRLLRSWDRLPTDPHLADGGKYRFRRHASFIQTFSPPALSDVPYRPHWQPKAFNKLHGGIHRPFAPIEPEVAADPTFRALIVRFGNVFGGIATPAQWFIEAHQFRIDASQGEGRPTPEGAHRDGVDFVALVLIERGDIAGGATTIHFNDEAALADLTLVTPWTAMLLDDQRVIHATTPIKPVGPRPHRDTLVLTYRRDGFLEPIGG